MKRLWTWTMLVCVLPLVAACNLTGSVNDVCKVLRKPPQMQSETMEAIHRDRPVNVWFASVNLDGKSRGCW